MPDQSPFPVSLPRPLRIAAVVLAALLLTSFFVYLGFPWDRLADRLGARVEQGTGMRLAWAGVEASPQLLGPGIAFDELQALTRAGGAWDFDRLVVRPAWSTSWFRGEPALHLDATSPLGRIRGAARIGDEPGFDGTASELDVAALLRAASVAVRLTGSADVSGDLRMAAQGPEGPLTIAARDGVLSHPKLPVDVPYETIDGALVLGGDVAARIDSLEIRSPMGSASIQGSIGRARVVARSPLDLTVEITVAEDIRGMLRAQRVRVGDDGRISLRLTGTLSNPRAR